MTFDYIVIGAGSAGCVVANRLSENPNHKVLLLEAGPPDKDMWIHVPAGMARTFTNPDINWCYSTEPEDELNGKRVYWPRGKTLGGSSAINGMAYVRGQPSDYDHWAQMGNSGWSWGDVLPLFKRAEDHWSGESDLHSTGDGIAVTNTSHRMPQGTSVHRATQAFIDGAQKAGLPLNNDFNGPIQEGVGWIDHTIDRRGRRHTTADAYLKPAMKRSNLAIETDALVQKIVIEDGRTVAVRYRQNGIEKTAQANAEICLCGGAVNSPQLLMLSGIGPAEQLKSHDIEPLVNSTGVGQNLQDHMYVHWVHEVKPGFSFNGETAGLKLLPHIARYYLANRGLLTTGSSTAYIFCKSLPGAETPDTQIGFRAMSSESFVSGKMEPHLFPGWSASVSYLRPKSRGEIKLKSAKPGDAPAIHANYLTHGDDLQAIMTALRLVAKVYDSDKMREVLVKRLAPAEEIDTQSDEQLEAYVRKSGDTMYHPVGTCRMGPDKEAVVDAKLCVNGVKGLRVADASIMPNIVSGNTNAPCIMIGEKAADLILADAVA